ncbi:glycerophosphodiester phosphodiesterase family protein [Enterococcus sp.]|uniref:glycerophosphodiester phosphodiesterase family protein n=1 Tax=Enterococcus sp. TaxID=35783 RepID=UPI0029109132|nr:glycerophosphodiester phosphodiesterase family protein [Enterococcus sp.]MDU5334611.1 glycerophosphodiester phosphodiesterase family protein [Enterococcus sp.]
MNYFRQRITHYFRTFSIYNFLLLAFGLPFLTEGLFLFFRQSFLNNLYHPFYLLLFFALIFLFGNLFSQVQSNEKIFENFSLKAAFASFAYWILLSPIFFFRFYQMLLVWQPLPARLLSFVFLYRWKILPVIVLLYLILLYFLYRGILVPKYLKQGENLKASWQLSWRKTNKPTAKQLVLFFLIPFAFLAASLLIKIAFIGFTQWLSRESTAMILLLVYRVIQNALWALFFLYLAASDKEPIKDDSMTKGTIIWLGLMILACLGLYSLHYAHAFQVKQIDEPFTISHRGVSQRNGVQNSIDVLEKTSKSAHPDLVEMDVQETADHQLVVIHDEDLKSLANKNIRIDESTWNQLKDITLKENGYDSKIPLFVDYLATANQLNQKLLIELKVTAKTKDTIVKHLLPLKDQLVNHQLQSMDLDIANQMKKNFPTMKVGYILPLDLIGAPKTSLDFINIESRTACGDLIQFLQHRNQGIYVWPVNSKQQAAIYRYQRVNGILSDDLSVFETGTEDIKAKTAGILQFD